MASSQPGSGKPIYNSDGRIIGHISGTDTSMYVSPRQIRNALIASDSLTIIRMELAAVNIKLLLSERALVKADELSAKQDSAIGVKSAIIANLDQQVANMDQQNKLVLDWNSYLKKEAKKANWRTLIIGTLVGLAVYGVIK